MSRPDEWLLAGLAIGGFVLVLVTHHVGEWICPDPRRRGWRK